MQGIHFENENMPEVLKTISKQKKIKLNQTDYSFLLWLTGS